MRSLVAFLAFLICFSFVSSQLVRLPMERQIKNTPGAPKLRGHANFYSQAGGVSIKNWLNMNYICPIKLGSANKTFNVVVDTGSSHLWVPHISLSQDAQNKYDCSYSKSCVSRQSEGTRALYYGKGAVQGFRIEDTLNLGDLIIPSFTLLLAQNAQDLRFNNLDGILGLSLNTFDSRHPSVLSRMMESKLINSSTFSIYMGNDATANGRLTGEIIFGGHDPKYALSEFQFVPVKPKSIYWEAEASAIGFGNKTNITGNKVSVIFDTGASFLVVPSYFLSATLEKIKEAGVYCSSYTQGMYSCDCSDTTKLPDIIVYFGQMSFNIPASSYFIKDLGNCVLTMMTISTSGELRDKIILGDTFLKNYYALYSTSNYTVGFAKALPTEPLPFSYTLPIIIILVFALVGACIYHHWKGKFSKPVSQAYQPFRGQGVAIGGAGTTPYPQQQRFAHGNYNPPTATATGTPTPIL